MADTTRISRREWLKYIDLLSKINDKAAEDVKAYVEAHGGTGSVNRDDLIDYAYGVATKYSEASASLSAEMYDAVAALEGRYVDPAVPADTPAYNEVAKTVNGILKQSTDKNMLGSGIGRLVKRTGVDTTMQNAIRDGAQWAWIPSGDTCAFCITLASRGWQRASKKALKNGHAEHIHSNCDCTYAVRFDNRLEVAGYDPDEYRKMYYDAEGKNSKDKINSMRRMLYAKNKSIVGAESDKAEELLPSVLNKFGKAISFERPQTDNNRVQELRNRQEDILKDLSRQYNTRLEIVKGGAKQAAGDVDLTGQVMRLNSSKVEDAIHEFAHTLANTDADKYGLTDDKEFWSEIRKIRTSYRKAVKDDSKKRISAYADSQNILDEFMAEAFTMAKAKELGIALPDTYGSDYTYADMVLKVINKYFKRK